MKLNCDLGESFGSWQKGLDSEVMPHIDMANIACGFHASDPLNMQKTVKLARQHNVTIGAHPGYPDLVGFGRRSIPYEADELVAIIQYQIGALQAICANEGVRVAYVKPHGALYNDMMKNNDIFTAVCQAVARVDDSLALMIQAIPEPAAFDAIAGQYRLGLMFEAFADRNYQDNGLLTPRSDTHAVITEPKQVLARCQHLLNTGELLSLNGKPLSLEVDTLCVHGDNPAAVALVKQLQLLIHHPVND